MAQRAKKGNGSPQGLGAYPKGPASTNRYAHRKYKGIFA